jgi:hypothetical protein
MPLRTIPLSISTRIHRKLAHVHFSRSFDLEAHQSTPQCHLSLAAAHAGCQRLPRFLAALCLLPGDERNRMNVFTTTPTLVNISYASDSGFWTSGRLWILECRSLFCTDRLKMWQSRWRHLHNHHYRDESADTDGHAICRQLIQAIYSKFDDSQYFGVGLNMTELREGSAAACLGCVLFLDAIDTYSDELLLENCIKRINVSLSSWRIKHFYEVKMTLYYSPDKALHPVSSPSREQDIRCVPSVDVVVEEPSSQLLEVRLELFLLRGMLSFPFHSVE